MPTRRGSSRRARRIALNGVRNRQLAAINLVLKNIAGTWQPG